MNQLFGMWHKFSKGWCTSNGPGTEQIGTLEQLADHIEFWGPAAEVRPYPAAAQADNERYGVWLLDAKFEITQQWCGKDPMVDEDFVGSFAEATAHASFLATKNESHGRRYEVRPYPEPLHEWVCPDCKRATPSAASFRLHVKGCPVLAGSGAFATPPTIYRLEDHRVNAINTEALALALFSTDDDVIAFCTKRAERPEAIDGVLAKAWERDENGWATIARMRATRVAARMAKKTP